MQTLTPDLAARFARIALGHVEREYPHKLDHRLAGPADALPPSVLHPVFHGSFDWHSCVHGYWLLAQLVRRFPAAPFAGEIAALFDRRLTPENVAGECAYFDAPGARGFERPYGWGWLLKLAAELAGLPEPKWSHALAPLAETIALRLRAFLPLASYPVRAGTHANTAFAVRMAADHAQASGDEALSNLLTATGARWYGEDRDCPAWGEPGGEDFLSPTLIEAECMRHVTPAAAFAAWFDRFLPRLREGLPATLFVPVSPTDRSDGKLAHLDGLNLSRAWCFRAIARALPEPDPRRLLLRDGAERSLAAALPHVEGDYMGEHWLASFATLALEA